MEAQRLNGRTFSRDAKRWLAVLAALALALPGAAFAAGFGQYKPRPLFAEEQVSSLYVPMRDGVRIAVAIHRPAVGGKPAPGRFPVVWHNALDIGAPPQGNFLTALVRHGYVVAIAARRGNGASFGTRRGYEDLTEAFDAYEMNEWLARQPWSTGMVGLYGCSNTGEAVMHALKMRPPHLKAAFAGCFSWDRYDGHTRGGLIANYGTGPTRSIEQDMQATPVDGDADRRLLRQAAEEHLKSTNLFDLMKSMPYRDSWSPLVMSRFWGEVSMGGGVADMIRQSGVPLYIQGGWWDDFRREAFVAYDNLPDQARVMIGPWRHCRFDGFDITGELLRFYDHYLKGLTTGIETGPKINYFTVGAPAARAWRSTDRWPLATLPEARLYLTGSALAERPAAASPVSFTADYGTKCPPDPQDAGPVAGPLTQPCHNTGGAAFRGAPLARDTEVTGHPVAELTLTADRDDAHVFVYLEDVAPDGTIVTVTEGRLRAALRKINPPAWKTAGLPWHRSWAEDAEPLTPGQPAKLAIDLLPTSYVFKKGHSIQVVVSGSDPRERDRMPGPPPRLTLQGGDASRLRLPMAGV
jgi:putative CocE/NonD family hydrolase